MSKNCFNRTWHVVDLIQVIQQINCTKSFESSYEMPLGPLNWKILCETQITILDFISDKVQQPKVQLDFNIYCTFLFLVMLLPGGPGINKHNVYIDCDYLVFINLP